MRLSSPPQQPFLRTLWPWLPLWAVLALLAIFAHGAMPLYSTRTLAVAWAMWDHHQFLVPHLNGVPYSHKTPLLYWLFHAGWWAFGVNSIWPRLVELGLGATELVLAALLARRLAPERPWVARATPWLLLALGYGFLFGLQIMYDVLVAVCVLAALLSLTPRPGRAAPRFVLFGICIGLGLLAKGPVMLLHVAFPWLLGPLWNDWARAHRGRWYGGGVLALLGGLLIFAAWLLPAMRAGGSQYAHELLFKQTEGRVLTAFDHARPIWWYLPRLLILLFPLCLWPRAWVALARLRRPWHSGVRFVLCWFVPVLLAFSLVSSKQIYYLLPEMGGVALLLALALAQLHEQRPQWAERLWLRPWPAALAAWAAGIGLIILPTLVDRGLAQGHWWVDLSEWSPLVGAIVLVLGLLVVLRGRHELQRLAIAGVLGAFVGHALFTLTQWQSYNLAPTAKLLAKAQQEGQPIANLGTKYAGQYHFLARLHAPIRQLQAPQLGAWASKHPAGIVLTDPDKLSAADTRYAIQVQPFRGEWVVAWRASVLAALRAGNTPAGAASPTHLLPEGYWRYRNAP